MNDSGFRRPEDLAKKEPMEPVSGRIKGSAKKVLEKAAAKTGNSLSWLVGRVLEDYAEWLKKDKEKT